MAGKSSRRKGKRAEYYIRDYLSKWLKAEVVRVPNSGNHKKFYGDLLVADKWKVEVKYRTKEIELPFPCTDGNLYSFTLPLLKEGMPSFKKRAFPEYIYDWRGICDVLVVKIARKEPVIFTSEEVLRSIFELVHK